MKKKMKRVLIVKEGKFGLVDRKIYQMWIDLYERILGKEARVEVIETAEETEEILKKEEVDAVVFISRGIQEIAERFADTYLKTRIVVFTGFIPFPDTMSSKKVIWVDKGKATDPQIIRDIVLW